MKDLFNRAVALGLGLAVESKEQIEKAVDELVKKGEINRKDSSEMVDELVRKGEEARQKIESVIREKVQAVSGERQWATRDEVELLVRRIEALERRLNNDGTAGGASDSVTGTAVDPIADKDIDTGAGS